MITGGINLGGMLMRVAVFGRLPTVSAPTARLTIPPAADHRCNQQGFVMTVEPSMAIPSSGGGVRLGEGVAQAQTTGTGGTAAILD